ncbi:hypothetical protein M0R45_011870 [Rubus argutus]|uniref:B-like cyclin n=1 Tax=Rubus argutus TaxID=59490 RepID=A0AAW1YBJ3_RUBAR
MDDGHFLADFSCQESPTFLGNDSEVVDENTSDNNVDIYYDLALQYQHVKILIEKEREFGFKKDEDDQSLRNANWFEFKDNRLEAIAWILRNGAAHGFQFRTAYLSITYFDLFLSKRSFKGDQTTWLRTLSVACLSLAAKMEEQRSPLLSEYKVEDCIIEWRWINQMELAVLATLEWRLDSITPFPFIDYFITILKLNQESPSDTKYNRIEGFLMYLTQVTNLMQHRPSVLAAAATIMAFEHQLTRAGLEVKINSIPALKFLEIEEVFSIYRLLQDKEDKPPEISRTKSCPAGSDSARETVTS